MKKSDENCVKTKKSNKGKNLTTNFKSKRIDLIDKQNKLELKRISNMRIVKFNFEQNVDNHTHFVSKLLS